MTFPHIEIGMRDEIIRIAFVEGPRAEDRIETNIEALEFNGIGHAAAAERIGSTVLHQLQHWSPEQFALYPDLIDPEIDELSREGIAHKLIHLSVVDKTRTHLASIDYLLKHETAPTSRLQGFLSNTWPVIRAQIETFPDTP